MGKYSLKRPCSEDFKKYKTISVGCLWAEQFAIKVDQFYREFLKILKNRDKTDRLWSRIAQLTGNPQKWFCTFWNPQSKAFPESIYPFRWVFCELSKLQSNVEQSFLTNSKNTYFLEGGFAPPQIKKCIFFRFSIIHNPWLKSWAWNWPNPLKIVILALVRPSAIPRH